MTPTMVGFSLTRRTVLGALPASFLLSQLPWLRWALAQDQQPFERQLERSQHIANGLAKTVRATRKEFDPAKAAGLQEQDYQGRSNVAKASLSLSQEQLSKYVRHEYRGTAKQMVERGIRLVPKPAQIVRLPNVGMSVDDPCSPRSEVIWDILLDSLGLLDERAFFKEAMNAIILTDGNYINIINRIDNAIRENRMDQAIDGCVNLLEFLLKGGVIVKLAQMLEDRLANRLLKVISVRLVPFVGTGYAIFALGLAVRRHWNRLFCQR